MITSAEFSRYHEKYATLNEESERQLEILRCNLCGLSGKINESRLKAVLSEYKHIDKLDFKTADIFIDKIFVFNRRSDGTRDIKIVWKI